MKRVLPNSIEYEIVKVLQYRENAASPVNSLPEGCAYNWTDWKEVPVVDESN